MKLIIGRGSLIIPKVRRFIAFCSGDTADHGSTSEEYLPCCNQRIRDTFVAAPAYPANASTIVDTGDICGAFPVALRACAR